MSETLHLTRRNPFFVADVGAAVVWVVARYLLVAVASGAIIGIVLRTPRVQAIVFCALGYVVVSLKIYWRDADLLATPHIAFAFACFTAGWFTAAILVMRRWSLSSVFPILLTVGYANVCLAIASGWGLGGGRLLPFLLSSRTFLIVGLGAAGVISATVAQTVVERRSTSWLRGVVPAAVLLALVTWSFTLMRDLPHRDAASRAGGGSDASRPDVIILSFDALRSDMLRSLITSHPDGSAASVVHRGTWFENVVAHGLSTDIILANNTIAGAGSLDCASSVPGALAARGYFTAMIYASAGKRFEGSDCYVYFYSGDGSALAERYALVALPRAAAGDLPLRRNALRARELIERLRRTATVQAPLFAYLHFLELHAPYVPEPKQHDAAFAATMTEYMRRCYRVACDLSDPSTAALVEAARNAYVELLDEIDRVVGQAVAIAKQRQRDYIIVLTADHGELLGEHGGFAHGGGFVPELLDVPFVVLDSRGEQSRRRCELLLSSEAMRTASLSGALPRVMYPDRDLLRFELPPLGRAEIAKPRSTIEFELEPAMMAHAGTWRNVHRQQSGTLQYPIERCATMGSGISEGPDPR